MAQEQARLLLVDDTPAALKLLSLMVETMGWSFETAVDGQQALEKIQSHPADYYQVIISDWMMPNLSGIDLLKTIKADPERRRIPVILQTALADTTSMQTGLENGAFYYLTKPLDMTVVQSVIAAAIKDSQVHVALGKELSTITRSFSLVSQARFEYKTLDQARGLSTLLAGLAQNPEDVVVGLFELMVNAVEHGNLGISYDEKTHFIEHQSLAQEVERRLALSEYRDKFVTVSLETQPQAIEVVIQDMGAGFDFSKYLEFSLERALDNHGRGIMMANYCGFKSLDYFDGGRAVRCLLDKSATPL